MVKYKLDWLENKTSAKGTPYIKASITPEGGSQVTDVAIFNSFPDFANLRPGMDVYGELKTDIKDYNGKKYTNYTLEYPRQKAAGPSKAAYMEKVVARKEESITKFQGAKEEGIKLSSTIRMAVDLTIAQAQKDSVLKISDLQQAIQFWRKWLWQEWERPIKGDTLSYVPESDPMAENPDLIPPDEAYNNL